MHEQLEKTIRTNLQTARNRLHEQKDLVINRYFILEINVFSFQETKSRFSKYSNQLNEIKLRLQNNMYGSDHNRSRESSSLISHRSIIPTSASLSALSHQHQIPTTSSNDIISTQSSRRQTIDTHSIIIDRLDDDVEDDLMCYINQTTETTRF